MIFTFLITIVFIAEIIIAIAAVITLLKLDKKVLEFNEMVTLAKPKVTDISKLISGISEQWLEMAKDYVDKFKTISEDISLRALAKVLLAVLLWKLNSKTINKIRNSKTYKIMGKGLSLLENMV